MFPLVKKTQGAAVPVRSCGTLPKLVPNKVSILKHSLMKTAVGQTSERATGDKRVPPSKKTVRPAAWLLHSVGLRLVREKVYDDLMDIQEEKLSEGALSGNEQRQLERLRGAFTDLLKQNRPVAVRSKRRCRCGFAAASRLELELHRDYGSVSAGDDLRYACCLCGLQSIRSPVMMACHIERCHGRRSRTHTAPPTGYCPYCPYEQRTITKVKLSRHVLNCTLNFRIDRNLAPTAADADIPLFEVPKPPTSSAASVTSLLEAASVKSTSTGLATSLSGSVAGPPALSSGCTTVSAAGLVMTPAVTQAVTTTTAAPKISLGKLARMVPQPEGLEFEVCELCWAFLAGRESMVRHMARAHRLVLPEVCLCAEKPIMSCDRCSERFWTAHGLSVHVDQMHGDRTSPGDSPVTVCPMCKRTRLTDVVEHLIRYHRITIVDMFTQRYCSICQLTLHAARPFEHHMLTRHSDQFPDRSSLYAAVVMVDRMTRSKGRIGLLSRGRQPAVLSGAASKPGSGPCRPGSNCPICRCKFADDSEVQRHVQRVHAYLCVHCGLRCTSAKFLCHHVLTAHSDDTASCEVCGSEVLVSAMEEHLRGSHVRPCAVSLTGTCEVSLAAGGAECLERKRRRGSESSDSVESSSDECDNEHHPDAKKLKTL